MKGKENALFWKNLDEIIRVKEIFIDRPIGTRHNRFPEFVYPFDYGYIKNTHSSDGEELDVWVGTAESKKVTGIMVITDMDKRESELKILYNCTQEEMYRIYEINNQKMMRALLVVREF
jgi:inorganic pyrophosphatase